MNVSTSLEQHHDINAPAATVEQAIASRMSVRAFLSRGVQRELVERILSLASRAASGSNTQPWKAYVLQGGSKDSLIDKVCAAHDAIHADASLAPRYQEEYDYYPGQWFSPYVDRRRRNGWGMYGLLGIERGQLDRMHAQHQRNFRFFGAPVGLMFTVDRRLGRGAMIDYGMFLQNVMLAARSEGLHTCPQAAWNPFASVVLPHLRAPQNEMLLCAMCLGYADESAAINTLRTPREDVGAFTTWLS